MAKAGYRILDSDLHLMEPPDLFQRYLDPAYRDRMPRGHRLWCRPLRSLGSGGAAGAALGL